MIGNELMINDYIFVGECHSNMGGDYDVVFNARPITIEDFKFWAENNWDKNDFNEFLEPIPLTQEILKKNGFKHYITEEDSDSFEYSEGNFSYCFNRTADGYMSCIDVTGSFTITGLIKYVHELQHIFRLCELSEMADKFKI